MANTEQSGAATNKQDTKEIGRMSRAGKLNAIVIYILIAILFIMILLCKCTCKQNSMTPGTIDIVNNKPAVTQDQTQSDVNKLAEEGKFSVFINSNIVLENGTSEANLLIQNEEANKKPAIIEIYTKDTNELIYRSYSLPAGYKIEKAKLDKELAKGTYDCKADFIILDEKTNDTISVVTMNVMVTVNN